MNLRPKRTEGRQNCPESHSRPIGRVQIVGGVLVGVVLVVSGCGASTATQPSTTGISVTPAATPFTAQFTLPTPEPTSHVADRAATTVQSVAFAPPSASPVAQETATPTATATAPALGGPSAAIPSATPAVTPEAAPVETPEASPTPARRETGVYVVQEGDSVSTIAEANGISSDTLLQANGLSEYDTLDIGQELRIPATSGALYVVKEGDTVEDIAGAFGVEPDAILEVNGIGDPTELAVAQELVIPGAEVAPRAILASRSGTRPPTPLKPSTYVVEEGDTLGGIADRFGISVETMLWANDVTDADTIQPGFELMVLPVSGVLHTVEEGDNLIAIAEEYGVDVDEILMANGINDPATLMVGDKILLPGGTPVRIEAQLEPEPTATPKPQPTPQPTAAPKPTQAPVAEAPKPQPTATPKPVAPAPAPAPAPAASSRGAEIVALAQQYLGYAYVWGGTTPNPGFDCTGFVYYITNKRLGMPVPRDLWGQLSAGTRVSRAQVQTGDLVFFQNTYQPGLSHVGIALNNSTFIHAASERYGVMISNLNDAYWAPRWYGATRP